MVNRNIYIVDSTINNMDTQTYGKQNMIKGFYYDIVYRFKHSRFTTRIYEHSTIGIYIPKAKKARIVAGSAFVGIVGSPLVPGGAIPLCIPKVNQTIKNWMLA